MMVALLNLSRLRFYILSFLFCTVTARADATAYTYCCSTGECTSLNASNFHLYIENLQALKNWTEQEYTKRPSDKIEYTADLSKYCPSGGAFNATSQMTKLVMMANPRCQIKNDPRYYVEILGDHNSNSDYRIDINPGSPTLETYYRIRDNYCINKATTVDRQNLLGGSPEGASFTALVTARMTAQDIYDSDADVLVRVIPEGYYDGVIYIAYNNTDGTDYCTQRYTPLLAEHIESDSSEYVDGTLMTVQWREQNHSDGYIVAVGDDESQCTTEKPCLVVKNTTRVIINFTVSTLDKIRIYNIITTNCTSPEIADELAHLFKGCRDDCCKNSSFYHDPTLVKVTSHYDDSVSANTTCENHDPTSMNATTKSTTHNTTPTTTEPDNDTNEGSSISSTTFFYHTVATTIAEHISYSALTTYQQSNTAVLIGAVLLVMVIIFTVSLIISLLVYFKHTCKHFRPKEVTCTNIERQPKHENTYDNIPPNQSHDSESGSVGLNMQISSNGSTAIQDSLSRPEDPQSPTTLIIYSPNTIESEQQFIYTQLIAELQSYGIETMSHDFTCIQGGPSAWLESEAKKATVVLCVCNKEFKDDWEEEEESRQVSLPLVRSLKHLIHGTVQSGKSLSKYAVVLLDPSHKRYIPTMYLQSDSRQFILTDTKAIAEYVLKSPSYKLSKESTTDTPHSSNSHNIILTV